ncbi:hypothetical protein ZHAS_00019927 [Anopheles sinensis]|uniref:Uncharacterized protein n=1 Tax=Anopheles sinensis TaxID=74873 RepID=A0A084WMK2_ANOSI|nr:hypothetical protein ZHAS_00019927 [Anopheles sinensis]
MDSLAGWGGEGMLKKGGWRVVMTSTATSGSVRSLRAAYRSVRSGQPVRKHPLDCSRTEFERYSRGREVSRCVSGEAQQQQQLRQRQQQLFCFPSLRASWFQWLD